MSDEWRGARAEENLALAARPCSLYECMITVNMLVYGKLILSRFAEE